MDEGLWHSALERERDSQRSPRSSGSPSPPVRPPPSVDVVMGGEEVVSVAGIDLQGKLSVYRNYTVVSDGSVHCKEAPGCVRSKAAWRALRAARRLQRFLRSPGQCARDLAEGLPVVDFRKGVAVSGLSGGRDDAPGEDGSPRAARARRQDFGTVLVGPGRGPRLGLRDAWPQREHADDDALHEQGRSPARWHHRRGDRMQGRARPACVLRLNSRRRTTSSVDTSVLRADADADGLR